VLPIGDEVRARDVVDGKQVGSAVTSDFDAAVLDRAESSREVPAPIHATLEPNTRALPLEPFEIPFSPQGPIKPRRAHFQLVRVWDEVGHVERRRYIPADPLAVLEANRALPFHVPVDEQAQDPARGLTAGLDLDEIEARVTDVGFGEQPQVSNVLSPRVVFLGGFASGTSDKKKGRARGPPFEKEATQSFLDAVYNTLIFSTQDDGHDLDIV
jgi:hypothetical protein